MKYRDYINLKLQNFSKEEIINFSINFAKDTTGYTQRITKTLETNKNPDNDKNKDKPNQQKPNPFSSNKSDSSPKQGTNANNQSGTKNALANAGQLALDTVSKRISNNNNFESFDPNKSNQKTWKNPVGNNKPTNQNTNQQNKQASTSPSTSQSKQSSSEKKTVKNWNGDNVTFEKRDGKWYREGTNDEVAKTGKYKSYFDENNGVKDVRPNATKSTTKKFNKGTSPVKPTPIFSKQAMKSDKTGYVDKMGNVIETTAEDAKQRGLTKITDAEYVENAKRLLDRGTISQEKYNEIASKYGPKNQINTQANQQKQSDKPSEQHVDKNIQPKGTNRQSEINSWTESYLKVQLDNGKITQQEYDRAMKNKETQKVAERIGKNWHVG